MHLVLTEKGQHVSDGDITPENRAVGALIDCASVGVERRHKRTRRNHVRSQPVPVQVVEVTDLHPAAPIGGKCLPGLSELLSHQECRMRPDPYPNSRGVRDCSSYRAMSRRISSSTLARCRNQRANSLVM